MKENLPTIEDRFLFAVLGSHFSRSNWQCAETCLRSPLDWRYIVRQADRHGVIPLLWERLHQFPSDLIPGGVQRHLYTVSSTILRHNLAGAAELIAILDLLEKAGIRAAPFKGPALALIAYGNLALRAFSDLDILVQPASVDAAAGVLIARGYRPEQPMSAAYMVSECQLRLRGPNESVVELHWRLVEKSFSCALDLDGLWLRMMRVELAGRSFPTLGPDDLFLYLCLHGAKHQWERLEWLCGIAELSRVLALNWQKLQKRAADLGCARLLYLALYLAEKTIGAPVPSALRSAIDADAVVPELAQRVLQSLTGDSPAPVPAARRAAHYRFLIQSRERLSDKCRIALRSVVRTPHPDSKELVVLSDRWRFLYYFLRPLRLAGQCAALAWRECFK